ncbi:MAG: carboxypeptidase-like regulatory domain-containing protein, partial [Acidobacteriota bacterium]
MMQGLARNWIPVVLVLMLVVSSHSLLRAQSPKREIRGRVVTDEGQALTQARVLLVKESVNLRREATPDAQGFYQFSELVEGIYRLEASAEGYLSQTREEVQLPGAASLEIDFRLQAERT